MRGHDPMLAMRKAGAVPTSVWFEFDGDAWRWWPLSMVRPGGVSAWVLIEPTDSIARLDMRFAVGLVCHVLGDDQQRVHRLHEALAEAGAVRVISTVMRPDARGAQRCAETLDTAGLLEA